VIRKRVIFLVLLVIMTVMSGVMLTSAGLIYYTGFLDGSKGCDAAGLER
tara:strand:+ start:723 stop:869 length:147 start_codon:yes stop_codon:yes gene_type:complete